MSHTYRVSPHSVTTPSNLYERSPDPGSSRDVASDETPSHPRRRHNSGTPGSLLSGLRNFVLRPRSGSLNSQMIKKPDRPMMKVQISNCTVDTVYDLREGNGEDVDLYDDQWAFRRPRSNSSDFLILRKTSRPLSVDVLGLVDAHADPYRQYMKVVDCYELAPSAGNIINIDKDIKIDQAFSFMCSQNIGAGLIWDNSEERIVSIVTITDFLKLVHSNEEVSDRPVSSMVADGSLVSIYSTNKILEACEMFCLHRVHRILVLEPTGEVLYLLTIKRILQTIHKQNRSLHFAQWLSCPIQDSAVGTWNQPIHYVNVSDTVATVIELFLSTRVSSLPLLDDFNRAIDVVTKTDIAKALYESSKEDHKMLLSSDVSSIVGHRTAALFLQPNETLGKVLDALLTGYHTRSVFVIDGSGKPTACISQSDVINHLTHEDSLFRPNGYQHS